MIVKKLIEKVEGEAELDFKFENGRVEDVTISFGFYRGIEEILIGKNHLDALVITPRVCGICNHAHLIAAVKAIESAYEESGINIELTDKAKNIRNFTLSCELIQNHIKWLYLTILPKLEKLSGHGSGENHALKASYLSSTITKALAIFAGQWPHSSYAVPGGVTCDPSYLEVLQAENLIDEAIRFFEQVVTGISMQKYLSVDSVSGLHEIAGDFGKIMQLMENYGMADMGRSHDRFIVFGSTPIGKEGKSMATKFSNIDPAYVREMTQVGSVAKAVTYKEKLFEVGPLARSMVSKEPIIKSLHKRYKDSLITRVFARVHEVALLLERSKKLLHDIRLEELSCTLNSCLYMDSCEGIGIVEAARGSLIHKTSIKDEKIVKYQIITPTQWTLSNGYEDKSGIAAEAMRGSASTEEASFIFRAFDICSVCTTQ